MSETLIRTQYYAQKYILISEVRAINTYLEQGIKKVWIMQEELRKVLNSSRSRLVFELDISSAFLAELLRTGIIKDEHKAVIQSESTKYGRVDRFLDILGRRPDYMFEQFIQSILIQQPELVECFKFTSAQQVNRSEPQLAECFEYTSAQQVDKSRSGGNVARQKPDVEQPVPFSNWKGKLDRDKYNDELRKRLLEKRPITESAIDPKGSIARHLLAVNVITMEEFEQINDAKERSKLFFDLLLQKHHPSSIILLRSALEREYKYIVDMLMKKN